MAAAGSGCIELGNCAWRAARPSENTRCVLMAAVWLLSSPGCQRSDVDQRDKTFKPSLAAGAMVDTCSSQPERAPASRVDSASDLRSFLPGRYTLTVVRTFEGVADRRSVGTLELERADSLHAELVVGDGRRLSTPLYGWTNLDWSKIGNVSLGYSPASRDPDRPGVQLVPGGVLFIGNAYTRRGVLLDTGVLMRIHEADSTGFRGAWKDGGLPKEDLSGYFCAVRLR
jgi:hypothetical protein